MGRYGKKYEIAEKGLFNVVAVYRERGDKIERKYNVYRNYLQRLEQFDKAIQAYTEALRWNDQDVPSLLGRSLARAKATHYAGALRDAARAAELEPENVSAMQIRAQTEYEKCAFERALVLAHRGQRMRGLPPDFAVLAMIAEETIRDCVDKNARNMLVAAVALEKKKGNVSMETVDQYAPSPVLRQSRMQVMHTPQNQEISRVERHKKRLISRYMTAKYLDRMAGDKYFLQSLVEDERLKSANKKGSQKLQEYAAQGLDDVTKRQEVLRERRPFYAAQASEVQARARLSDTRKQQLAKAQEISVKDAQRLIAAAQAMLEKKNTTKCLENAEFAMEQVSRKPPSMLPGKEKILQQLQDIVAQAFLDQKRVSNKMSESDREKRAFILLGICLSREPSRDSVLRVRPSPTRDARRRLRALGIALELSPRPSERCYLLHEISRLHIETKQAAKARLFALKCQKEARAAEQRIWLLNATFLLARALVMQNNRPEARAALLEAAALARSYKFFEVAEFFDTCVNISTEGEVEATEASLVQREKAMIELMQDDDMRSEAQHLFRRMSALPAQRRFSVLPGTRVEDSAPVSGPRRRQSISPASQMPTQSPIKSKARHPLGFQDFDNY